MAAHFTKFTQDEQDPKAVERVFHKINDLLSRDEEIQYIAIQKRPAVSLLPDSIVSTNRRIFICSPANLGLSMNYLEFPWAQVKDVSMKEEIFGAKFVVYLKNGNTEVVEFIPKVQARKLYRIAKDVIESASTAYTPPTPTPNTQIPISSTDSTAPIDNGIAEANRSSFQSDNSSAETDEPLANGKPLGTYDSEHKTLKSEQDNWLNLPSEEMQTPTTGNHSSPNDSSLNHSASNGKSSSAFGMLTEEEVSQKLIQLKSFFDRQLISRDDYEAKKTEILSRFL